MSQFTPAIAARRDQVLAIVRDLGRARMAAIRTMFDDGKPNGPKGAVVPNDLYALEWEHRVVRERAGAAVYWLPAQPAVDLSSLDFATPETT